MAIPHPGIDYPSEYWKEYVETWVNSLPFVSPEIQAIAEAKWPREERKPKPLNNIDPNMIPPTSMRQGDHSWDRFDNNNIPHEEPEVLYPSERGFGYALEVGFHMMSDYGARKNLDLD